MEKKSIVIENFGPLKKAEINIKPFTIFIGPNSCGKSFIAKLIHCLSLNPNENISEIGFKYIFESFKKLNENNKKLMNELFLIVNNYLKTNPTIDSSPLQIERTKIDNLIYEGIIDYLSEILSDMIKKDFIDDLKDLINFNENFFKIQIGTNELYFKKDNEKLKWTGDITICLDNDQIMRIKTVDKYFNINIESRVNEEWDSFDFLFLFYRRIGLEIFKNILLESSFYIPAERSEIIMDKKLMIRKIQNKSDVSKNQSEVMANLLNIDLSKKSVFYNLACELEEELSNISINIDDSEMFNTVTYTQNNDNLSPELVSTSIHEISIFILYLKYVLKEGDLLIIEEPEAHLHPKNQRLLVKYFVKAINKGLKILITTHSDYIVAQVDNMINLKNMSENKFEDLNYSKEDILNFEDINIYNFKGNSDTSFNADEIQIDSDGFIEDEFSKITNDLYEETLFLRNSS